MDVNLRTITDTLPWYKFSPLNGIRVKPKLHRRRRRIYENSYNRRRSQKLFIQTIYENLASIVKNYHAIIETTTLHRSETSGIAERAVRRAKGETSAVLLRSGSDDKWWLDSMIAVAICKRTKTSWQTGNLKLEIL